MSATTFCLLALTLNAALAEAGTVPKDPSTRGLRGKQAPQRLASVSDVEAVLTNELSNMFHGGAAHEHIASLEKALAPMHKAAPKEADGTLGHGVVRYLLHRFFVQQHGWFIRGLEPGNTTALEVISGRNKSLQDLQGWVPNYLQKLIEEMQGGRGINLRELAVLVASLEDLIHKESTQRLEMTFNALELPVTSMLDEKDMQQALEVYLMIYMLGGNFTVKGRTGILKAHKVYTRKIKTWAKRQEWMRSVQLEVAPNSTHESFNFSVANRVVEEIGLRYGDYNDGECNLLKNELLEIESTKAGRVRLTEFYKKGLSGMFAFREKIEYLRMVGAVDDSDPNDPHLIVPNYVSSRSNCMMASTFYAICCRNECEKIQGALENKFESSMGKPDQILELVSGMSTKTLETPRKLPDRLVQRLHSIANANEGEVPFQGRLFAQWMHHAFPRECPYPHPSGGASPMTPDEWMRATGQKSASKTNEEMQLIVNSDSRIIPVGHQAREHHDRQENELPWDQTEEHIMGLVMPAKHVTREAAPAAAKATQRSLFATIGALASLVASLTAFVWKMAPRSKQASVKSSWREGMLV